MTIWEVDTLRETKKKVPPTHKAAFTDWQHSELPWFQAFRRSIALYTHELAPAPLTNTDLYDKNTHHHLAHHTLVEHLVPSLLSATPPELLPSLPSALSPLTSLALHLPRTAEHFRIPNDLFLTALRRKLRLPVLPDHLRGKCRCPSCPTLDPQGDHLFSCSMASKTALSNAVRDTVYDLLSRLAPAAGYVEDCKDVHIKPPGLAPQHTRNVRPADVGLLLKQPQKNEPFNYVAIDVTIPPPHARTPLPIPVDNSALGLAASRPHQEAARSKFCHDDNTAKHLLANGVYMIPFTVDHLGSLGSFAQRLLFHQDDLPHEFSSAIPPQWPDAHFGRTPSRSKQRRL